MFFQRKRRPITYMSKDRSNQNQTEIKPFHDKNVYHERRRGINAGPPHSFVLESGILLQMDMADEKLIALIKEITIPWRFP
jgi:hypothetical protein